MRQLVANEFRHSRSMLIVVAGVAAITAVVCALSPDDDLAAGFRILLILIPIYFGLTLPGLSFRSESRNGTWLFLRALPVSGDIVVSAKFWSALAALTAGTAVATAGLMVADGHLNPLAAANSLALPLMTSIALLGLNFGLCFWLGERSAGLGMLVILAAAQIGGMLLWVLAPNRGGVPSMMMAVERWIAWAATPPGLLLCAVVALAVLVTSWAASIQIYDSRDITHPT